MSASQTASVQVSVTAVRGFHQDVILSCFTGLANLSCNPQPAVVGGGSGNAVVLVTTGQAQSAFPRSTPRVPFEGAAATALFAAGLFLVSSIRGPRWRWLPLGLFLFAASLAFGCGNIPMGTPQPPVRSYVVTVVAASQDSQPHAYRADPRDSGAKLVQ